MGLIMSTVNYIFGGGGGGPEMDVPDKVTGLSKREQLAITSSWDLIKVNAKENGVELFIRLFKAYPKSQDFFEHFKGKDPESLRKKTMLRVHGTTVMHALNSMVESIDDPECLIGLLERNALSHYPRGIRIQHYQELWIVFINLLKDALGSKCTPETVAAWEKALKVINSVIETELTKQSNIKD
ncbi:hypothetical protein SNE40_015812 [Patella caerulea]|uniref:Globin n=1 Tax=Patella caerulea TaxID=87958 RepID=A0AAN8PM37_PATCE